MITDECVDAVTPVVDVCVRISVPVVWGEQVFENVSTRACRNIMLPVMSSDIGLQLLEYQVQAGKIRKVATLVAGRTGFALSPRHQ